MLPPHPSASVLEQGVTTGGKGEGDLAHTPRVLLEGRGSCVLVICLLCGEAKEGKDRSKKTKKKGRQEKEGRKEMTGDRGRERKDRR